MAKFEIQIQVVVDDEQQTVDVVQSVHGVEGDPTLLLCGVGHLFKSLSEEPFRSGFFSALLSGLGLDMHSTLSNVLSTLEGRIKTKAFKMSVQTLRHELEKSLSDSFVLPSPM